MLSLLVLLLVFTSRAWTAAAQADSATDSIRHTNCSETAGSYEANANSAYKSNILRLGADLAARASSTGFASGNSGADPDTVYGLVLCRGDYTGPSCTEDLNKTFRSATTNSQLCKGYKDVTLYYDQYMLRFSDKDFRPGLGNDPEWPASNKNNVTGVEAARRFMDSIVELMNAAADFAAFNASKRPRYATGEAWFGDQGVDKLYGLVQCTPDLAEAKCRSCLGGIIAQMPARFSGENGTSIGGRILGVRCNLRYEKDLFFEESSETLKLHRPKSTYFIV